MFPYYDEMEWISTNNPLQFPTERPLFYFRSARKAWMLSICCCTLSADGPP